MRSRQRLRSATPRLLCIDQYADIGGGQRSLLDLLPAFSERGWKPAVATPGFGPFERELHSLNHPTHKLVCGNYSIKKKTLTEHINYACELPRVAKALDQVIAAREINLLYVNGPRMLPSAAWMARRYGIPLVFHCHNRLLQSSAIALAGKSLKLTDSHVIACCDYAADPLRKYIGSGRLKIRFNGVENMALDGRRAPDKIRRIGVVGRVEVEKGQAQFVEAARIVLRSFPECRFTIVGTPMFSGDDYYNRVVELSRGLPLQFYTWRNDMAQVYSDLDLLVVPSSALEATTRVIIEAYSAGVPVVAFPSGGIPEILQDNETGFLANESTAASLADRIVSILSMDETVIGTVVDGARKVWRESYTVEAYRESVCGVLAQAAYGVGS